MKKLTICFIIMLMLGGIFGLVLQNILPDAPVSGVVYADATMFVAGPHAPPGPSFAGPHAPPGPTLIGAESIGP